MAVDVLGLPDKLMLEIFSYLSFEDVRLGVAQTCHEWHHLSLDASLCRMLKFSSNVTDDIVLKGLEQCSPHIQTLDLGGCKNLTRRSLLHEGIKCPKVKTLIMSGTEVEDNRTFRLIMDKFPHLEIFHTPSLKRFKYFQGFVPLTKLRKLVIEDAGLSHEEEHMDKMLDTMVAMKDLVDLDIHSLHSFKDEYFSRLSGKLALTHLDVSSSYSLGKDTLEKIFPILKTLKYLNLTTTNICDQALSILGSSCSDLEHLEIQDERRITDMGLREVLIGCPKLCHLSIGKGIKDKGLAFIADLRPELETLEVATQEDPIQYGISDKGITTLASSLNHMRVLRLSLSSLTDNSLRAISNGMPLLEEFSNSNCYEITSSGVSEMVKKLPKLLKLSLTHCLKFQGFLSWEGTSWDYPIKLRSDIPLEQEVISNECYCFNLREINVTHCLIHHASLKDIVENCPDLKTLHVKRCSYIKTDDIRYIADSCQNLTEFSFGDREISSDVINYILPRFPKLEKLDICMLADTQESNVIDILSKVKWLTSLNIICKLPDADGYSSHRKFKQVRRLSSFEYNQHSHQISLTCKPLRG